MSASFTVSNGNTTIKLEYKAPTATIQSVLGDAAAYLWGHGYGDHGTEEEPILFDDLTNQQKLDLIYDHVKDVIVNTANTRKSVKAQEAAREIEEASKYEI